MKIPLRPEVTRCVLVHPYPIYRLGLRGLLAKAEGYRVVGEGGTLYQATTLVLRFKPHVLLLSVSATDPKTLGACFTLARRHPKLKIMLLLPVVTGNAALKRLELCVQGLAFQTVAPHVLLKGVQRLIRGYQWKAANVGRQIDVLHPLKNMKALPKNLLSRRESQTIQLVAKGFTNRQIGKELGLTEKTIKNYLANVFQKLNVKRRAHAATLFVQQHSNLVAEADLV